MIGLASSIRIMALIPSGPQHLLQYNILSFSSTTLGVIATSDKVLPLERATS